MINKFITAVRTLTRIPIKGKGTDNFASSLPLFPVVGFFLAAILSGIIFTIHYFSNEVWNEATALFIIILSALLTGALHLDGFADWADSLGAIKNKEKMLMIMKDSNIGAFGTIGITLLLLAKWIILVKLLQLNLAITGLFISYISSRFAMVYLSVSLPYARTENGTGKTFIQDATFKHLIIAFIISISLLLLVENIFAIIIFILSLVVIFLWKLWCKKNLNGITGDLLGAGSEFVEVSTMLLIVLVYRNIFTFF
jgi:adenosylcobinamide-GDP ribazoletransferase